MNVKLDLMASFRQFQTEAKYTDLKITGQDSSQTFNCHRLVLSAASMILRQVLSQQDKDEFDQDNITTIIIPNMSPDILIKLANYIYGGVTNLDLQSQEMISWFKCLGIPLTRFSIKQEPSSLPPPPPAVAEIKIEKEIGDDDVKGDNVTAFVEDMRLLCPFKKCGMLFDTRDLIENHITTAHKLLNKSKVPAPDNDKHKCKHCSKRFLSPSKLAQHQVIHGQPENPFICMAKGCEKAFKLKRYLLQHSKIHEEKRGLTCELCNKLLAGPRELRAHLRVHTGEKPYFCKECGASFRNRSTCSTHMKVHNNQRNHVCPEPGCNHAFIQLGDLRKHVRSKHTNEKPFTCDQCGKAFARSDYLLKHLRAHQKSANASINDEDDVNALLSEAILNGEDVATLEGLETTELVLDQ